MVSVVQAQEIIGESIGVAGKVDRLVLDAAGFVLRETVSAAREYPPFDRVTMDGIGIDYKEYESGRRSFCIAGIHGAGSEPPVLVDSKNCFEVMTGSVCPQGVNCVVPVEMLAVKDGVAIIVEESEKLIFGWNIHPQGSDCPAGKELLRPGQLLNSTSVAVAASEGKSTVQVSKLPRIAVISSGDELVDLDEVPKPWQIRRSNSYAIASQLKEMNLADVEIFHIDDDKDEIKKIVEGILVDYDFVIMSGAVSKGKFDYIPVVLDELKVEKKFHCVTQRPGKPFWFGVSENGKAVFALPGNPVSAVTGFRRYIVPALLQHLGRQPLKRIACLNGEYRFKKPFTYFLPVKVSYEGATLTAVPHSVNGSGDFSSLAESDGFIELVAEEAVFLSGHEADYYPWNEV